MKTKTCICTIMNIYHRCTSTISALIVLIGLVFKSTRQVYFNQYPGRLDTHCINTDTLTILTDLKAMSSFMLEAGNEDINSNEYESSISYGTVIHHYR